jgi:outer membrane protein
MKNTKFMNLMAASTLLAAMSASTPLVAGTEAGDILVRARVINIAPDVSSEDIKLTDGTPLGVGVDVDDAATLDIDITYMYTDNFGIELLLAIPAKHDVTVDGTKMGDVTVLPPALIAQWHFMPANNIRPYAGAGINYTFFFSEETTTDLTGALDDIVSGGAGAVTSSGLDVDDAFGLVAQAGVDVDINKDWYVNFDVKYIALNTKATITANGANAATVDFDLNPWVLGVGVGTSF